MHRMVTFRSNRENRHVAVNPDQVLYVCHYEHGACTLHFGKDCFVRVQGDMADVIRRLETGADDIDAHTEGEQRRSEEALAAELN